MVNRKRVLALGLWCKAVVSVLLANKMTLTLRFAVK